MKRLLIITFLTILACTQHAMAATATINKTWIEHNLTINGRNAMRVHCQFSVKGMKSKKGSMRVWMKDSDGKWHKMKNASQTSKGTTYFSKSFTPSSASARYNDLSCVLYLDNVNFKPGKHEYSVIVTINDDHGKILAQSKDIKINGTGASKPGTGSNKPGAGSNKPGKSKNKVVSQHRENIPGAGFKITKKYTNGLSVETYYGPCPNCRGTAICQGCMGTKRCGYCQGQGSIRAGGYGGTLILCQACRQTGFCSLCGGSGICGCSNQEYPGYVIYRVTTYSPDGRVIYRDDANYNDRDRDRDDKDNGRSSKKTCPDCGGTKLFNGGQNPEYDRPTSTYMGIYHKAGSKCKYCGHYDEHWHSKCITCMRIPGKSNRDNPYK